MKLDERKVPFLIECSVSYFVCLSHECMCKCVYNLSLCARVWTCINLFLVQKRLFFFNSCSPPLQIIPQIKLVFPFLSGLHNYNHSYITYRNAVILK